MGTNMSPLYTCARACRSRIDMVSWKSGATNRRPMSTQRWSKYQKNTEELQIPCCGVKEGTRWDKYSWMTHWKGVAFLWRALQKCARYTACIEHRAFDSFDPSPMRTFPDIAFAKYISTAKSFILGRWLWRKMRFHSKLDVDQTTIGGCGKTPGAATVAW